MHVLADSSLVLLVGVSLARLPELFPFLIPLQLGKLAVALGTLVVLTTQPKNLQAFFTDAPMCRCIAAMYVIAALGIPGSVWRGGAIDSFKGLCTGGLVMLLIFSLAVRGREQMLRLSCFASVAVLSVFMLLGRGAGGRLSASDSYDPNDIALLFVIFLPGIIVEFYNEKKLVRIGSLVVALCAVLGVTLTQSRGGLFALCAVAIHGFLVAGRRRWLLLAILILGGGVVLATATDSLWNRFSTLFDQSDYNFDANDGRVAIWIRGLEMMLQRPFAGVGIGQFGASMGMQGAGTFLTAHNSFVQVGAELGVSGLLVFLSLLLSIRRSAKAGSSSPLLSPLEQARHTALLVGLTGYCVGGFFLSQGYGAILFTFTVLAGVSHIQLRDRETAAALMQAASEALPVENEPPPARGPTALKPPPGDILHAAEKARAARNALLAAGDMHTRSRRVQPPEEL